MAEFARNRPQVVNVTVGAAHAFARFTPKRSKWPPEYPKPPMIKLRQLAKFTDAQMACGRMPNPRMCAG